MKLNELATEYNLDAELLQEVVEEDLSIPLDSGMDSELQDEDVRRILACDGLETVDGEEFEPIIDEEYIKKHDRSLAAKKAAQTRKRKLEEDRLAEEEKAKAAEDEKRRKHEEELERRQKLQEEEEARLAAEQEREEERAAAEQEEAEKAQAEAEAAAFAAAEAEVDAKAREERAAIAKAAALAGQKAKQEKAAAKEAAKEAKEAAAKTKGQEEEKKESMASRTAAITANFAALREEANKKDEDKPAAKENTSEALEKKEDATPESEEQAKAKREKDHIGRLAALARSTAEKRQDQKQAADAKGGTGSDTSKPDSVLTDEERRAAIQATIRRNLQTATRVKQAKTRKEKAFKTIDRSSGGGGRGGPGRGGPGGGPGGPGGQGGPGAGGPPGPVNRGGRRGRTNRKEKTEEEGDVRTNRKALSTDADQDLGGVTEFAVSMPCTVRDFCEASGLKANVIIAKLFMAGVVANVNSALEKDAIDLLADEFKKTVTIKEATDLEDDLETEHEDDNPEDLAPRPPIVTILGHVDHGKTSLLDAIRKSQVTADEAGGITQHIGAYTVKTDDDMAVTFIDTPGHEAFTEMRARGAQSTDIAVIVIAANDGMKPQTIEAINHAKAAGVEIVIAMNKMDVDGADSEKVLRQLSEQELIPEAWGGPITVVPTSAITGQGVDELLETLALHSEVLELKSNFFAPASGIVLEAHTNEGRGNTATLLVQRGSLAAGDIVLAGHGYGRVRNMRNWQGEIVDVATPSYAVEIIGLSEMPRAGDRFHVMQDLKQAAEIAGQRQQKLRERELHAKSKTTTLASLFDDIEKSKLKELRLVVKADTSGSIEVLRKTLEEAGNDEVSVNIIHAGVGCVSTGDITLAEASNAIVVGFHVIADAKARLLADDRGIDIKSYTVIYELLDNVKAALSGMLDPETLEKVIGHAEIRQVFKSSKFGTIAGCYVTDGKVQRGANMRLTRDGVIIHTGKVNTLRRFSEDVREVKDGYECGLTIENFHDVQESDSFEFFITEKLARSL